jgi:hypothetical protein
MKTQYFAICFVSSLALLSTGCGAPRFQLAAMSAVSMTQNSLQPGETLVISNKEVEAEFCTGDDALVSRDSLVGLMDEASMKAQKKSGADYLMNVQYWADGDCIIVTGTPATVTPIETPAAAPK